MIAANELRIGNLVMTNNSKYRTEDVGKIACITQIDSERTFEEIKGTASLYLIDDKWKDTYGQWLTFLEPITITEEWLLKLGFVIQSPPVKAFRKGLHFGFFDDDSFYFQLGKGLNINIKYVHQLQNLYFALSQTELELKC